MTTYAAQKRLKGCLVVLVLLVSIAWASFFSLQNWITEGLEMQSDPWSPTVSSIPFIRVHGTKTLYLNAFYEHREAVPTVRLLAIVWPTERKVYHCILCCHDERVLAVLAQQNVHNTHFWFPSGTGEFLCQIPQGCQPRYAGLVAEAVYPDMSVRPVLNQIERQSNFPFNFAICLPPMYRGYNNVLQFIQAMELYSILGAEKVVLYKIDCSLAMERVVHYYSQQVGLLEVIDWPVEDYVNVSSSWISSESPGDLHYYGQIPALNDCVYRFMYQAQYLILHDRDEVILPTGNSTWKEFLSTLQSYHGKNTNFYFENNIFRLEEKEDSGYDLPEWSHLPGVNFLLHLLREPIATYHFTTGKLIVNPRTLVHMSVHSVEKLMPNSSTVEIGPELGKLYHVRRQKNMSYKKSDLVRDDGMLRFAPELVRKVRNSLHHMNLLKK